MKEDEIRRFIILITTVIIMYGLQAGMDYYGASWSGVFGLEHYGRTERTHP
jgi:hypothetical protein